jgi:tRNA pseudouridine38-40 synthase
VVAPPGRTLKLTLAYDGGGYVGWQRQASGASVQGALEEALARFDGSPVAVVGAGRTDAGVHALGQVASARLRSAIGLGDLQRALNAVLPPDIRVLRVEEPRAPFHARYGARSKTYQYAIANGPMASPFEAPFLWLVPQPLDVAAMASAASRLEGRHDFAGFASLGARVKTTVRTLTTSAVRRAGPGEPAWAPPPLPEAQASRILYVVTGDGFLRQMVRAIAGTLVEVGTGRRPPDAIDHVLASGSRADAGPTAPPHGLCLVRVTYDAEGGEGDDVQAPLS